MIESVLFDDWCNHGVDKSLVDRGKQLEDNLAVNSCQRKSLTAVVDFYFFQFDGYILDVNPKYLGYIKRQYLNKQNSQVYYIKYFFMVLKTFSSIIWRWLIVV